MKSSTPLFQGIMNAAATHSTKIKGVMKGLGLSGNSNSLPVDNTHIHSSSNNTSNLGAPEEGDIIRGSRQGTGSSIGQSIMGANRITPRPEDGGIPPILPPQPDNVAGSLSSNAKAQSLGENLWEGEAFAEQRASKRQVGANPVPTPGSEFDAYGGMFSQPLAQSGEIREANKQRRQDRRQRVKDIKTAGGPENYSADGYHVGEYDKKGRNIQYPEKRYSKKNPPTEGLSGADVMSMQFHGFSDLPDDTNNVRGKKIPLNQSGDIIKRREGKKYTTGKGMDETDLEEGKFKSSRLGTYNNEYNTQNVSNIQEDKKGQFMTSISDNESWDETPRPTSNTITSPYKGVRDTLRPAKGKHFKMGWGEVDRNPSGRKWKKENK